MNRVAISTLIALSTTSVFIVADASAQSSANSAEAAATAPDNTKSNKVDQSNRAATADAQTNKSSDIDLTRRIRKSVMADKALSTYAHNVKIVAVNGSVTLNGVVRSEQEKSALEMKAAAVAGKDNVINDLKVAPKN
jgi:hyperosmotically inducible periplasmic protein